MVDNDAIIELARLRGTNESEAVRQAVAEALADEQFNAASRTFFSSGALRRTFSDRAHVSAVYGEEFARQVLDDDAAVAAPSARAAAAPPRARRRSRSAA
jgi:hypothetical protein